MGSAMMWIGVIYILCSAVLPVAGVRNTSMLVATGIILICTGVWFETGDERFMTGGVSILVCIYVGQRILRPVVPKTPAAW